MFKICQFLSFFFVLLKKFFDPGCMILWRNAEEDPVSVRVSF